MRAWTERSWLRFMDFWLGPCDPIRLDTFRVGTGLSLIIYQCAWWRSAHEWLTTDGFHVSAQAWAHFPAPPPLPPYLLPWFGIVYFGSLLAVTIGWKLRRTSWLALAGTSYVSLVDPLSTFTLNKVFMLSLAIMAVVGRATYWSVDRQTDHQPVSVWPIRILQCTLLVMYSTSGWCKIHHGDWLHSPYVLLSQVDGFYRTELAALLIRTLPIGAWILLQNIALGFELFAPILFMMPGLRTFAMAFGVLFQLGIALMLYQLIYFGLQMICLTVIPFASDAMLHRVRGWIRKKALSP